MAFSEAIKLEVKRKAAFQCCRCKEIGVEVHHIVPEEDGGPDEIDNAAPLCPSCHDNFGGNPDKRNEIRQMRDWWYDVIAEQYKQAKLQNYEPINEKIEALQKALQNQQKITDRQQQEFMIELDNLKTKNTISQSDSFSQIKTKTTGYISATTLSDRVHANFHCRKCNTQIGLLVGINTCPNCGEPIN